MSQLDTRTRIQRCALRLFNDNGYEATSLREIAEEVGVTKAALYYHFKTKEEIITSLIDDRIAQVDELLAWGATVPRTTAGRRALIERYANEVHDSRAHEAMRFFERNPTALRDHPSGERMKEQMLSMIDFLVEPGAPLTTRLKSSMALLAVHATLFLLRDESITDDERRAAGLEVALELLG